MARQELEAFMRTHGLTIEAIFVPFSKSRNAKPKGKDAEGKPRKPWLSLNWKCRLLRTVPHTTIVVVQEIDYSAGVGHCKSPKNKVKHYYDACIAAEIETGLPHLYWESFNRPSVVKGSPKVATPDACDVLAALALDASVLDCGSFEDWASEMGYDCDSREAEAIYHTCLAIALKLRNGLGEVLLAELREACQDY